MSIGAASPGGTDSLADAEGSEQVDALGLQVLCSSSSYACRGETVVMPRDQAFDDVTLGGWEASPTADTTSQIQLGNAAPRVNVNPGPHGMSEMYVW